MKAPFPYFGGKSKVASVVWEALGDVDHYLEPFFGSGAVLLARENWQGKTETICDKDGFIANLWRSLQFDPDGVSKWADWPVNHNDLIARIKYLKNNKDDLVNALNDDPKYFNVELAGYWIWGQGCGIGNWMNRINQIPLLSCKGMGIHATKFGNINERFKELSNRLRKVRVVCGDWTRICGGTWQDTKWKDVGYFFDPPYGYKANRCNNLYGEDSISVAAEVARWCLEKGKKENWRIVLAGYFEEHDWLLEHGWSCHRWKSIGGYIRKGKNSEKNKERETLFLSPNCNQIDKSENNNQLRLVG